MSKSLAEEAKRAIQEMKDQRDKFREFEAAHRIAFMGLLSTGYIASPKEGKYARSFKKFMEDEAAAKVKFKIAMDLLEQAYVHADNALFTASWERDMFDFDEKERLEKVRAENEEIRMK